MTSGALADGEEQDLPLPPLRQELGLFVAPRNSRGEAGWTVHDPVRNRYFRLGEREFVLLTHWQEAGGVNALVERVAAEGVAVSAVDVAEFAEFLMRSELTEGDLGLVKRLYGAFSGRQQSWWKKLLHNYLFLRIPLVRPDPWLDHLYPVLRPMLSRRFARITVLAGLLAVLLVARQWDIFVNTFLGFLSWQGAAAFAVALVLVKVLHEAGHAIACRHFGLRVPSIGVVFIVMWPVMYTDATEAWRLTSRRARIAIAAAGMATELTIACYATLLWVLLPDGLLRSVVFTLATTTWIMSLAVNLNPLMKFDGYYLFADILDIPNLQDRGFDLARNRLRHLLFGIPRYNDPGLLPGEQRIAIAWAYATWVYRFFLFLGIAFLVYAFFFKALGIFLFLVEIWWFIAAPIWREVRHWRQMASRLDPLRGKVYWIGGGVLALLLVMPWESNFQAPGMMRAGEQQRLFPVEASRLLATHVASGSEVRHGDVLFELASPDLDAELAGARAQVSSAEYDLMRVLSSQDEAQGRLVAEESLSQAQAALQGLEMRAARMRVLAPFAGVVRDVPPVIRPGLWVGEKQSLGIVVGRSGGVVVDAYVAEEYLRFVEAGDPARFYPEDPLLSPVDGQVEQVDRVDTRVLPDLALAEPWGGSIPVRQDGDLAIPEQAIYRVRIRLADDGTAAPGRVSRGAVRLSGDDRSLLGRAGIFIAGALLRESGF